MEIDIERAKRDFEYFYNNILQFQDKEGNTIPAPPLKDYQKTFLKWLMEMKSKGVDAIYINHNTRYQL